MSEVGLLWLFMIGTLVVLGGLMFIFRGWMAQKDAAVGQPMGGMKGQSGHGHH